MLKQLYIMQMLTPNLFLQRISIACYSKNICPSVCPSHAGTVSKRL